MAFFHEIASVGWGNKKKQPCSIAKKTKKRENEHWPICLATPFWSIQNIMSQPSLRAFSVLVAVCAAQLMASEIALAKGGGGHGGGGHSSAHSVSHSSAHSSSHSSSEHAAGEHAEEGHAETSKSSTSAKAAGSSEKSSSWTSWFKRTPPSGGGSGGSGGNGGSSGNPGRPSPVRNNGYRGNGWGFGGWGRWPWRSSRPYYHPYYFAHTMGGHRQGDPCDPGSVSAAQKNISQQSNPFQSGASAVGAVAPVDLGYATRQDCVANPKASDDFEDNESHSGRNAALAGGAGLLGAGAIGAVVLRRRRKMGM